MLLSWPLMGGEPDNHHIPRYAPDSPSCRVWGGRPPLLRGLAPGGYRGDRAVEGSEKGSFGRPPGTRMGRSGRTI